ILDFHCKGLFLLTPNLPCVSDGDLLSVNIGDEVTLPCSFGSSGKRLSWYQQRVGEHPQIISSMYKHSYSKSFNKEFTDRRFSVHTEGGFYSLNISDVQKSDSAMYYCGHTSIAVTEFDRGTFLMVKVDQSSSENIHAGDSVTLNCTVHTGSCDEEHSIYWFKDSEDSHPGLIYTHGGRNDQCERKNNTQTHSCVYELPMKNLTESHAGIYYCAVVSCGHKLFGNGTKLDLAGEILILHVPLMHVWVFSGHSASPHISKSWFIFWLIDFSKFSLKCIFVCDCVTLLQARQMSRM
uniref:Ig-like domain-containing protein n=1 Tax=Oryzias sinensis TaxID=183150 RepID=A0A8C7XQF9_9TELE